MKHLHSKANLNRHRKFYRTTAIHALLFAIAELCGIAWLALERFFPQKAWTSLLIATWGVGEFVLLSAMAATLLVLAGAMISLHRDSLETRGLPYAGRPREWHGGFVVRAIRTALRGLRGIGGRRHGQLDLCSGELVEIRSLQEILATLDARGELDSLPFMPEMEPWCGRQARVFRRVDKIFDWITSSGLRRMHDTVILEGLRCDGSNHGECQADCPVLWKEAWLRRASTNRRPPFDHMAASSAQVDLQKFTTRIDPETSETRFVCQLCRMPHATTPTPWNDPRNMLRELFSGNVRMGPFFTLIALLAFNAVQKRCGAPLFPVLHHCQSQTTPHAILNIQPGELVRIKTKQEIEQTSNAQFKNRGLWFDAEMTRFCGGTYPVRARVNRQIDERTGKMITINTPCITLEGVTATGEYHEFAPLDERIYWREIWLERVEPRKLENRGAEESCSYQLTAVNSE